ncbi:GNAT family N-acetyltransferase [Dendronalium sp. ChiSLP03b]|uniref:GNAT family N-acetyltransferase n=1 Tax=Dendronalium sp. ChiSLP03b TaxID=3075381 RepID=UPI00391ADF34
MNIHEIELRENFYLPPEQVLYLYSQCGWSSANKPEKLLFALSNSETVISAWHQDILVGLGNAISDGALVVYYPHLLVLPSYQRCGIGSQIIEHLKQRYSDFHQQILLSVANATPFYEKVGFHLAHNIKPMWIYDGSDI